MATFQDIDQYIDTFPDATQTLLQTMRRTIHEAAPEATEAISYDMPTFKLDGKVLVHFAGYKHHIGFYALPTAHESFRDELTKYKVGKGSVQFPIDKLLPLSLIRRMVEFRVKELQTSK
jgi:uncharacterized protein YdhG (YjbR/CyaY superfamily)